MEKYSLPVNLMRGHNQKIFDKDLQELSESYDVNAHYKQEMILIENGNTIQKFFGKIILKSESALETEIEKKLVDEIASNPQVCTLQNYLTKEE